MNGYAVSRFAAVFLGPCLLASASVACMRSSQDRAETNSAPASSVVSADTAGSKVLIGLSMDTLKEERWQRDRDALKAQIEKLGGQLLVQVANGDDALQNSQAENLLTQGVKVLIVAPHNGKTSATIVASAHRMGVPVVAYDRMILDADLDYYVSFDNFRVGVLQAQYLVDRKPTGNYVILGGAPTDNNARLFHDGQMHVLKPLVDKGQIKIVADQWAKDWQPIEALRVMENALTKNDNHIDAVVAANDGNAGAAAQALAEQRLSGKVVISGQDAELSACQRIAAGTQSMSIYKPIKGLASAAGDLVMTLARRQPVTGVTATVNNGAKDVPAILMQPLVVDRDNLMSTVIADGFQKKEDVFKEARPRL